jgi:hypothetical protein
MTKRLGHIKESLGPMDDANHGYTELCIIRIKIIQGKIIELHRHRNYTYQRQHTQTGFYLGLVAKRAENIDNKYQAHTKAQN